MDDASLEDFLGDSTESEENSASVTDGRDTSEDSSEPPTSRWCPGGTRCAVCGETAGRLWKDDEQLVCGSCKNWD